MMSEKMTVKKYLKQRFIYGGKIMVLGDIIIDLKKLTHNQRCVDAYVTGLFLSQKPII